GAAGVALAWRFARRVAGERPGAPADVNALVRSASEHYRLAQEALRAGDFAAYGRELKSLEDDLAQLRAATGPLRPTLALAGLALLDHLVAVRRGRPGMSEGASVARSASVG
ncbi:MAG: hypothetical protein Q7S25_01405, partial [Candidatus Limnocylindria bacterium]|nr:hypothetical protein [Candidatus Limnocylindria bacterium]